MYQENTFELYAYLFLGWALRRIYNEPYLNDLGKQFIPYLRSEILGLLAYNRRLSKSMMESKLRKHTHFTKSNHTEKHHHRPEILQAVDYLETKRLIKKLNTDPGPGLIHGRGRPKTYFAITEEGLKTLLADTIVPTVSFWKIVYYYCLNNESLVTPDKIEQYYRILIGRYLKYPNRGFSSPLDIFHNVYNKWIKEAIVKSNKITTVQKIIEVLAINPRISDKKLDDLIA